MKHPRQQGFTLVELMMVVAIISIIMLIAIPSYNDQRMKTRRADGKAALMSFANAMERQFTDNGTYAMADGDDTDEASGADVAPDTAVFPSQAPLDAGAGAGFYNLRIREASDTTYTVVAIPTGIQTGDDACGTLSLTNAGTKGESGTENVAYCW